LNSEESFAGIAACIAATGHAVEEIHTILLTHGHTDHIAGVHQFLKHITPRLMLSAQSLPIATSPDLQSEQILPQAVREIVPELADYDVLDNFRQTCGEWVLPEADVTVIHGGDRLQFGQYCFVAIPVPGHEVGLMMFYEGDQGIMLTTDFLRSSGAGAALPWYSSSAGGVDLYFESLAKVEGFVVQEAFPSHGGAFNDYRAAVAETHSAIVNRQKIIEKQLSVGSQTCRELDRHLYSARALELCPWYSSVTEAHLAKLEKDGRLIREGLRFSIANLT
jgi:glyoxylase-like metal-dependent hydrolase (beta-lactamase superfamily II)